MEVQTENRNEPFERPFDLTSALMEYEDGQLGDDDTIRLFQYLVDTGLAWSLQGMYGRTAEALLKSGLIQQPVGR